MFSIDPGYIGYPYDLQAVQFTYTYPLLCLCVQTVVVGIFLASFFAFFRLIYDVCENPEDYGAYDIPCLGPFLPERREGDSREARAFRR